MLFHASIGGTPEGGVYSQTLISGNYFGVVSISGEPEKVTIELGRNVVSKIEEVISQTPEITPSDLVQIIREDVGSDIVLSLLIAFVSGQKLIVSSLGEVGAKIIRKGALINLGGASVSGNLLQDDIAIFGTTELIAQIKFPELVTQSDKTPEELKETVLAQISEAANVAGLILKLNLEPEAGGPEENIDAGASDSNSDEEAVLTEEATESLPPTPPPTWGKQSKMPVFLQHLSKLIPTKQNILYLKQVREQGFESAPPKKTFYFVVLAFVVLLSVVAFQLRSRSLEVQNQVTSQIEKSADEGIAASSKLIGLNDQMAREALTQKRTEIVAEIEKNFGSDWKKMESKEGDRLRAVVAKIDNEIARAANINKISPTTFYDFSILKADPKISSAQLHDGFMVALDSANGSVYSLRAENKSGTIVGGGNFDKSSFVDFAGDNLFVYTPSGIRQKNLATNGSFKTVAKDATSSGTISSLVSFAGNLYVLDPSNNEIWKYQGTEEGTFTPATEYIQPGANLDLSDSKGMVIDGFVYVYGGDTIWKFASGAPEEFQLKSLAAPIGSIDSMYASDKEKNIYIWDAENNRIVVVNKEGLYQAQYQLPARKKWSADSIILADEEMKKIFLVSGSKVYGVDIK